MKNFATLHSWATTSMLCGLTLASGGFLADAVLAQPTEVTINFRNIALGGKGILTGLNIHPKNSNVLYLRGDGGAYRWDSSNSKWIAISDKVPGGGYNGVEAIAVDPNETNANKVYLVAPSTGNSAADNFFTSTNRGDSWSKSTIRKSDGNPIYVSGNDNGKSANNRLVVDPNNANVLYYSSRKDGLYRSVNGGANWSLVSTLAARGNEPEGLTFVAIDGGNGTTSITQGGATVTASKTVYVGSWSKESTGDGGIYRTLDGGNNWTGLGGPHKPWQGKITPNGKLYVTYASAGVRQITRSSNTITDISPSGYSSRTMAALDVALSDTTGNTLIACQFNLWSDLEIFRSINEEASWTKINGTHSGIMPWDADKFSDWTQAIAIDPSNPKIVWMGDEKSAWRTTDATVTSPAWTALWSGLEAMTVYGVWAPPAYGTGGAVAFVGGYDPGMFRITDVTKSPGSADHIAFSSNVKSIDFIKTNAKYVAHTFSNESVQASTGGAGEGGVALSDNNGATYSKGVGLTTKDKTYYGGKVAVGATTNSNGVPFVVHATQGDAVPRYSADWGSTWSDTTGLPKGIASWNNNSRNLISDFVNGNKFYALRTNWGGSNDLYYSTNGGKDWTKTYNFQTVWSGSGLTANMQAIPGKEGKIFCALAEENQGTAVTDYDALYYVSGADTSSPTITKVGNVRKCHDVAIGAPKSSGGNPAVYILGKVRIGATDYEGLWRSDDAASSPANPTWVRIGNPDTFPLISRIRGWRISADLNTYGRIYFGTGGRAAWVADSNSSTSPPASPGSNLVSNPGFEAEQFSTQTPSGWSEAGNSTAASYTESNGGTKAGAYHGTHWASYNYTAYTYQIKTGLANGLYTLRCWAKSSGGQSLCQLEVKDFGGTTKTASLPVGSSYQLVEIKDINVTNGQCTIGIWSNSPAHKWAYFDDFELVKQ